MMSAEYWVLIILLLGVAFYTASFGVWTWKKRNRLGAIMIFLVAIITVILPIYTLFFREA